VASSLQTLVYVSRLQKSEKEAIFAQDAAFPGSNLKVAFLEAVEDVCLDRLVRADNCLKVAKMMFVGADEEALRITVGRTYYSIHHSLRAIALYQNKWDPDGHEASIQEFKTLLKDKPFCNRSGLKTDAWEAVAEARSNRHVADYSPYETQRLPAGGFENITGRNWAAAAQFNLDCADTILQAAFKIVGV
jgi:uncharacterized protein (UPF0332 family)